MCVSCWSKPTTPAHHVVYAILFDFCADLSEHEQISMGKRIGYLNFFNPVMRTHVAS